MVKARLPETQLLGLNPQGGRTLIDTSTAQAYRGEPRQPQYSLVCAQRLGETSKQRTGTYITRMLQQRR
jgi:hypothetical protein